MTVAVASTIEKAESTPKVNKVRLSKIAQKFGVRVYTIGVGTKGFAPYPFKTPFGTTVYQDVEVQIDEETLQEGQRHGQREHGLDG